MLDPVETGLLICGTVETVRNYYVEQARRGLANYFIVMFPFGNMNDEQTERTLEAFIRRSSRPCARSRHPWSTPEPRTSATSRTP